MQVLQLLKERYELTDLARKDYTEEVNRKAMPTLTEISEHYVRFQGDPQRVAEIRDLAPNAPSPILVVEYAPPSPDYHWVYRTIGVSQQPLPVAPNAGAGGEESAAEFFIYSTVRHDDLFRSLAQVATYAFVHNVHIGSGHSIAGEGGKGIVATSPLTDILVTLPYFEPTGFSPFVDAVGHHTEFFWVIPLYRSEREFARSSGWGALEQVFEQKQTDTSDLWRAPAV